MDQQQLDMDFEELDTLLMNDDIQANINMNAKNVTDLLGLSDKNAKPQSLAIKHYEVDIDMYQDLYDTSTVMQQSVEDGEKELSTFGLLHQDMFLSLFKYKPETYPESQMKKSSILNSRLIKKLAATDDYKALRRHCRLDLFNSALGAEVLGDRATEIVTEWKADLLEQMAQNGDPSNPFDDLDDLKEAEDALDDLLEDQEYLDDLLQQMQNQGASAEDMADVQKQLDDLGMSIQQAEQLANAAAAQVDDFIEHSDDILEDLATRMTGALSDADNQVAEESEFLNAWGLDEGESCRIPFGDKKEAVERIRNTPKLKKLTDLIGRFTETAIKAQKKKSKDGASSIKSVTVGNRVEDIMPSEKMKMMNDTTRKDFYRKFNQKELLLYKKESTKPKAKGPIICCIDTSGSMQGGREKWSKAVAIGMLEIANLQKRDYAAIHYSNRARKPIIIEKNEMNPTKVLDIAEFFDNGGTDFQSPLEEALELIKQSKFSKADIVFITDGECSLSTEFKNKFNRIKEEKDFSCMGVLVDTGSGGYGGRSSDASLKEFCDTIQTVSNIADLQDSNSEVAKTIFSGV